MQICRSRPPARAYACRLGGQAASVLGRQRTWDRVGDDQNGGDGLAQLVRLLLTGPRDVPQVLVAADRVGAAEQAERIGDGGRGPRGRGGGGVGFGHARVLDRIGVGGLDVRVQLRELVVVLLLRGAA